MKTNVLMVLNYWYGIIYLCLFILFFQSKIQGHSQQRKLEFISAATGWQRVIVVDTLSSQMCSCYTHT